MRPRRSWVRPWADSIMPVLAGMVFVALLPRPDALLGQEPRAEDQRPADSRQFLGAPATIVRRDLPRVTLVEGDRIYSEPDLRAPVILRIDVMVEAELVASPARESSTASSPAPVTEGLTEDVTEESSEDASGDSNDGTAGNDTASDPELSKPLHDTHVAAFDAGWRRVRVGNVQGWLAPPGTAPRAAAEIWTSPSLADEDLRGRRVARLRELLGAPSKLGEFQFFSDLVASPNSTSEPAQQRDVEGVADLRGLLALLDGVALELPQAYRERYGLGPPRAPHRLATAEAVVLFRTVAAYRSYLSEELEMTDAGAAGVSPHGLAVLAVGDRATDEVVAILIHELTHVLNRRWFGEALPAWLEEGLAEDLSYHPVDRTGRLRLGELPAIQRSVRRSLQQDGRELLERHWYTPSPRVAIACAARDWTRGAGPDALALSQLSAPEFSTPEGRGARYAESAILVRTLLDGAGEGTAAAFRSHLARVETTRFFDFDRLLTEIGTDYEQLSIDAGSWARAQARGMQCRR